MKNKLFFLLSSLCAIFLSIIISAQTESLIFSTVQAQEDPTIEDIVELVNDFCANGQIYGPERIVQ